MQSNQSKPKQVPTPYESAQKGLSDATYDAAYEQGRRGLTSGVSPNQLSQSLQDSFNSPQTIGQLNSLVNQIANQTYIPEGNDPLNVRGLIPALIDKIRGGKFEPRRQMPVSIGKEDALKLLNLSIEQEKLKQSSNEESRRVKKFEAELPGIQASSEKERINLALQKAQNLGDFGELNKLLGFPEGTQEAGVSGAETPITQNPAYRAEFAKKDVERISENRKDLDKYVGSTTPLVRNLMELQKSASLLKDYEQGVLNQIMAKGDVILGEFAQDKGIVLFNAAVNRMLGLLVKTSGDTGAFSDPEQLRQAKAIGKAETPLSTKLELINSALDNVFTSLDTKKELAQVSGDFDKRFPIFEKGRKVYQQNQELLSSIGPYAGQNAQQGESEDGSDFEKLRRSLESKGVTNLRLLPKES